MNAVGIVIVAHEPMASALYACGCHVFACEREVLTFDVGSRQEPSVSEAAVLERIYQADTGSGVLVLTDIMGATPANVARRAAQTANGSGVRTEVVAGANMSMLLRALTYRSLPLADVTERVLAGGRQAVMRLDH